MNIRLLLAVSMAALLVSAGSASAQVPNTLPPGVPTAGLIPGSGFQSGLPMNGLTPDQMQAMMMMRAMGGGYGHHGVRTGVPNPIIDGGYGNGMMPYMNGQPTPTAAAGNSKRKSSTEKRAAVRAQREEQKRASKTKKQPKQG